MGTISDRWAKTFMELLVWKKSMNFVTVIYSITGDFPKAEMFGLTSQLRRAAVSIPSNIAEGFGRKSKMDFARHCHIAIGSLFEVQTQLVVAQSIGYLTDDQFQESFNTSREIERMLTSFIDSLTKKGTV